MTSTDGSRTKAPVFHPGHAIGNCSSSQPQDWLRARARLMPHVLTQAPPWVRGVFDHAWAPMQALARHATCLPVPLLNHLLTYDGGFIAISTGQSRYAPGPATLPAGSGRFQKVHNVAFVSVEDLAGQNERPIHVIGHLIDHHLGCAGELSLPWLSEGDGITPALQAAGARLPHLFALGYGVDQVAQSNVRDYFAQSLALFCQDRQRLNVADPQIYKWLRSTLYSQAFWQGQS